MLKLVAAIMVYFVRLEVLTVVSMKISVFWVVALCSLHNPEDGNLHGIFYLVPNSMIFIFFYSNRSTVDGK
jgi:hypothetical protein